MFLKKNLIFNTLQDEFIKRNFFPDNESKEYVFGKTDENYKCERFLKLIIKKKRCKEFIACMREPPFHSRIFKRIQDFQEHEANTILNGKCETETCFYFLYPVIFSSSETKV